jgi:hypothetical protein
MEIQKNVILNDVLSAAQVLNLQSIIDEAIKGNNNWQEWANEYPKDESGNKVQTEDLLFIHKKELGRIILHNLPIPVDIINRLTELVASNGFSGYTYINNTSYFEYNGNFGNPKLPGHLDYTEADETVHLDYQISSSIDWAVTVEGVDYILKDNQALTFMGKEQEHGRPFRKFKEGEFVNILLFRFTKGGD